jgi:hypothetical protein
MATTTPNYGWTVPTSTDLVKDGATAIETLGDAIDASMNTALGTKKAGMVLLNTTSFSGVSSQAIPANTFSATYDNYKFILNCTQSTTVALFLRMRTGSTNTATGYAQAGWSYKADSATAVFANSADRAEMALGDGDTAEQMYVGEIQKPFLTSNTGIHHQGMASYQNKGVINSCILKNSTSYDAIFIYPGSGTITGTIKMFGYNN